jgi:hypothetical protein
MKISIQREFGMGTCGCTPIYYDEIIEVTPKELVHLIDRCSTISICNK